MVERLVWDQEVSNVDTRIAVCEYRCMDEKKINGVKHVRLRCDSCGGDAWKKKANIGKYPKTFCSKKCENDWKRTGDTFECSNPGCEKLLWRNKSQQRRSKSGECFCSRSCATVVNNARHKTGSRHGNWNGGEATYRDRAIRHYGARCSNSECEIESAGIVVSEEMLDAHHLNGRSDHEIENLIVLCVWCHAKRTRGIDRGVV